MGNKYEQFSKVNTPDVVITGIRVKRRRHGSNNIVPLIEGVLVMDSPLGEDQLRSLEKEVQSVTHDASKKLRHGRRR
ncbi:MAG: hypothetical protein M1372_02815 [Patescibacteria group bacterium]|nr:hypothetical protein [Patescibacteria group bacterium]